MFIVRLLSKTNSLRQFEAGQLETVLKQSNAHDEERAHRRNLSGAARRDCGGDLAVKPASGSQFGSRLNDADNDHSDDEIALPAGSRFEDGIQLQVAQATEDRGDM